MLCKLLSVECGAQLQELAPRMDKSVPERFSSRVNVDFYDGLRLEDPTKVHSLESFKRSFAGQIHHIFAKVPKDIKDLGENDGWRAAMKRGQSFLGGTAHSRTDTRAGSNAMMVATGHYLEGGKWIKRDD